MAEEMFDLWATLTPAQATVLGAIIGAVVGGIISPLFLDWLKNFRKERRWAKPRKKLLKELLARKDFRTMDTLSRVSGTTPEECRTLLIELGARGALLAKGREGWTLRPIGTEKPNEFDEDDEYDGTVSATPR